MSTKTLNLVGFRSVEENITPGLQCCLRCGRLLTDRTLHDALEEPVLASIGAEHPEWMEIDGCRECVLEEYRRLLNERMSRTERVREQERRTALSSWWGRLFGGTREQAGVEPGQRLGAY